MADENQCPRSETPNGSEAGRTRPVGMTDALVVLVSPSRVFCRMENTGAYGLALLSLLVMIVLLGYLQVQTGLIDRIAEQQTEANLARLEAEQIGPIDRIAFRDQVERIRKHGEFSRVMMRIGVIAAAPAGMLASLLLIAALLYAAVALTGRKPEYHTLLGIGVYAAYIELLAYGLRVGMMFYYRSHEVSTSPAMLIPVPGEGGFSLWMLLAGVDPFRVWFWVLVAIGLVTTRQLSRRATVVTCSLLCLLATAGRTALAMAEWGVFSTKG